MEIEQIATAIVDAAVKVHRTLGPGLLESCRNQPHENLRALCVFAVQSPCSMITVEQLSLRQGAFARTFGLKTPLERVL